VNGTADDLREWAARLRSDRRPFVTATVVRAEKPTSAKAGDSALVLDDGTVIGFVGGDCARSSVQAQGLATLDTGDPVLLRISPDALAPGLEPQDAESGMVTVHNPCLSGGALEIFLEPSLPPALVVIHGDAPIARAVRELAGWLGLDARPWEAWEDDVPPDTAAVVVASHGGSEPAVIDAALRAGVPYIGLIASYHRGRAVMDALGLSDEDRVRVSTPAGIDIGARTPQEVALAVLAEIVSVRPRPSQPSRASHQHQPGPDAPVAADPVCGMNVAAVDGARHLDHEGVRYWFCGSGCEDAFRANPGAFVRP
jgi:xanthine dehydrogenase accessory factor